MQFVGLQPAGVLIRAVNTSSLDDCEGVLAAVPYARYGSGEVPLFDECLRAGKPLHFYGRSDGTCPIDPRVLQWLVDNAARGVDCRLVPHYLHAKVIWWRGQGAYVGSANLTDRAWNQNYEAGLFLTDEELERDGTALRLRTFFDQLEDASFPLTQEECDRQRELDRAQRELRQQLYQLQHQFEDGHTHLHERSSPITVARKHGSADRRRRNFIKEWNGTLELIRSVAAQVASDQYRPDWIAASVPAGVQCDQFLHAYYYLQVEPHKEKDAYQREYEKHRANPERALRLALQWWKAGDYPNANEARTIVERAPRFRTWFAEDRILQLSETQWVETLVGSYAFGDHTAKMRNESLGLGPDPGRDAKKEAHARLLYRTRTISGRHSALEAFRYALWGAGEAADRVFTCTEDADYKLPNIGPNILGEIIGWVRPDEYPPRNARTSKALRSLGRDVKIL